MKNNKKGSVSLETTLVIAFIFSIVILFFLYGYFYFSAQNQNINLNFNVGRYVSTTGCNSNNLSSMNNLNSFNKYRIVYNEVDTTGNTSSTKVLNDRDANVGQITLTCPANSTKGSEFIVKTTLVPNSFLPYFNTPTREVYYVQETD